MAGDSGREDFGIVMPKSAAEAIEAPIDIGVSEVPADDDAFGIVISKLGAACEAIAATVDVGLGVVSGNAFAMPAVALETIESSASTDLPADPGFGVISGTGGVVSSCVARPSLLLISAGLKVATGS